MTLTVRELGQQIVDAAGDDDQPIGTVIERPAFLIALQELNDQFLRAHSAQSRTTGPELPQDDPGAHPAPGATPERNGNTHE